MLNSEVEMFWKLGSSLARAKRNNVINDPQFQQAALAYNDLKAKMCDMLNAMASEANSSESHELSLEEINGAFTLLVQTCQICSSLESEFLKDKVTTEVLEASSSKRVDALNKVAFALKEFFKSRGASDEDE